MSANFTTVIIGLLQMVVALSDEPVSGLFNWSVYSRLTLLTSGVSSGVVSFTVTVMVNEWVPGVTSVKCHR